MSDPGNVLNEIGEHILAAGRLLRSYNEELSSQTEMLFSGDRAKVISLQEEERRRIARDLHDGPVQNIANIVLRLDLCEQLLKKSPASLPDELSELKSIARSCLDEVRKFIYDLRPMALDDLGFASAMRQYIKEFSKRTGIGIDANISSSLPRLKSDYELAMFRIAQEALNNVYKHSDAGKASIDVNSSNGMIILCIQDNGKGFKLDETLKTLSTKQKFGLVSMRERAELLGADIDISTSPGKGTSVTLTVKV
ncbi:MAG: sensor histidine kinase [bacterium]|nr:sensor histidine kinase [bacterium]